MVCRAWPLPLPGCTEIDIADQVGQKWSNTFLRVTPANSFLPSFLLSFIHSFMHPCIHASIHPFTHSSMHPCIHASMHPCIHASLHRCIHASMHPFIHSSIHFYFFFPAPFSCLPRVPHNFGGLNQRSPKAKSTSEIQRHKPEGEVKGCAPSPPWKSTGAGGGGFWLGEELPEGWQNPLAVGQSIRRQREQRNREGVHACVGEDG